MKTRKILIIAALTTAIGSSIAFAGARSCGNSEFGGHGFFSHHKQEHMQEHMLEKMSDKLDLSSEQENALREIMNSRVTELKTHRHSKEAFRAELLKLDPTSADFDANVIDLAEKHSQELKQKYLNLASVAKQVSSVLTVEQTAMAREIIADRMEHKTRRHENKGEESSSD